LISEIVAIDVPVREFEDRRTKEMVVETAGRRPGGRIDPLGVLKRVEVFKGEAGWNTTEKAAGKGAKKVRPSEINHGNIAPSIESLGITCDYLEHSFVLSFAALRRLRFGAPKKDAAARSLLAALGLLALMEQDERGYALRSRCDLVCDGRQQLQIVHPDGTTSDVEMNLATARKLYQRAVDRAVEVGFSIPTSPLVLQPQNKLVEIVRRSQELALAGAGTEGEGD
jgi:CRISPR-associated protein Csb1